MMLDIPNLASRGYHDGIAIIGVTHITHYTLLVFRAKPNLIS